jgi:hypothetical protein
MVDRSIAVNGIRPGIANELSVTFRRCLTTQSPAE